MDKPLKKTIRIFITSPGDVANEREKAREVIRLLQRRYIGRLELKAILWEDMALGLDGSFQKGIDQILDKEKGVDIAIMILWSRLGSPVGSDIVRKDGSEYRSGTEREFEMLLAAREENAKRGSDDKPFIIAYSRKDDKSYKERLQKSNSSDELQLMLDQFKQTENFIQENFHDQDSGTNIRAYHTFDSPSTFANRLRVHLQNKLDDLVHMTQQAVSSWDILSKGSPFRGLEGFDGEHEEIFFGREQEVSDIQIALNTQADRGKSFILVVGASGSGKSSLIRAGVIPSINHFDLDIHIAGLVDLTPGLIAENLIAGLAKSIFLALPDLEQDDESLSDFIIALNESPSSVCKLVLKPVLKKLENDQSSQPRLILLVDQLEELFTHSSITAKVREMFIQIIYDFAKSGLVWVLATIRSDFYNRLLDYPLLAELIINEGQYNLLAPEASQIQRIITEPAILAGLEFEEKPHSGEKLNDYILSEIVHHPEALPLLEYTLRELYEARQNDHFLTFAAYESLGGVEGAVGRRAEELFGSLSKELQENVVPQLFRSLVTTNEEGEFTSKPQVIGDLSITSLQKERTLETFVQARLITSEQYMSSGENIIRVAHESLIRCWPRLNQWLLDSRDFLQSRTRLEASMKLWQTEKTRSLNDRNPNDLLLPEGKPIVDAQMLMQQWGEELSSEQKDFIVESLAFRENIRKKRLRQFKTVLVVLCLLTIGSILGGVSSCQQSVKAKQSEIFALQMADTAKKAELEARKQENIANENAKEAELQKYKANAEKLKYERSTFRNAFQQKEFNSAIRWLEKAKITAKKMDKPTEFYEIWQNTLYPRANRVLWGVGNGTEVRDFAEIPDTKELVVLTNNIFYKMNQTNNLDAFKPIDFDAEINEIHSFVLDGKGERLLYCGENAIFSYALNGSSFVQKLKDGISGGIYNVLNSKNIWFIRNKNLEIWSPDLQKKLESYSYPYIDRGYMHIGVLDQKDSVLFAKIGNDGKKNILAINYKTGEILFKGRRQGSGNYSLVKPEGYYISTDAGNNKGHSSINIYPQNNLSHFLSITTPWEIKNILSWDKKGFRVACADGNIREYSYLGKLQKTISLEGVYQLNNCISAGEGFIVSSKLNSFYCNELTLGLASVSKIPKLSHYDLRFESNKLWNHTSHFIDILNPKTGLPKISIKIDADLFTFVSGKNQMIVYQFGGKLAKIQLPQNIWKFGKNKGFVFTDKEYVYLKEMAIENVIKLEMLSEAIISVHTKEGIILYDLESLMPIHQLTAKKPFLTAIIGDAQKHYFVIHKNLDIGRLEMQLFHGPHWAHSDVLTYNINPKLIGDIHIQSISKSAVMWIGMKDGRVLKLDLINTPDVSNVLLKAQLVFEYRKLDEKLVKQVYKMDSTGIRRLQSLQNNQLAVAGEDNSFQILDAFSKNEMKLSLNFEPFSYTTDKIIATTNSIETGRHGVLLKSAKGDYMSLMFGRKRQTFKILHPLMGVNKFVISDDMLFCPKKDGTSIDYFNLKSSVKKGSLILGNSNKIGPSKLNMLIANTGLNRLVSYSEGALYVWEKDMGRWASAPTVIAIGEGFTRSSIKFINSEVLIIANPYNFSPSVSLLKFNNKNNKFTYKFKMNLLDAGIKEILPQFVAANSDYLFFGDSKHKKVVRVDLKTSEYSLILLKTPPCRLELVGKSKETLVIGHSGHISLFNVNTNSFLGRVLCSENEKAAYDTFEIIALASTNYFLVGYQSKILLFNCQTKKLIRTFPVKGYVWLMSFSSKGDHLSYVTDIEAGKIPLPNLSDLDYQLKTGYFSGDLSKNKDVYFSYSNAKGVYIYDE